MNYENFQTFDVCVEGGVATVTFNFGSVNVLTGLNHATPGAANWGEIQ